MAVTEQHCTILFNSDRVQSVQQVRGWPLYVCGGGLPRGIASPSRFLSQPREGDRGLGRPAPTGRIARNNALVLLRFFR